MHARKEDEYVLFAQLDGPQGQHYGCFMEKNPQGYTCPDFYRLEEGTWDVSVLVVRSQCPLKSLSRSSDLLQYIEDNSVATFEDWQTMVNYPYKTVLDFKWKKPAARKSRAAIESKPSSSTSAATAAAAQRCTGNEPGRWIPFNGDCSSTTACAGPIDQSIFKSSFSEEHNLHHIFAPFDCHFRVFDAPAARQCITDRKLVLAGDSRVWHIYEHIKWWLGDVDGLDTIGLANPQHIGLSAMLNTALVVKLYEAAVQGRAIVINSLLHDVADFRRWKPNQVGDVRLLWNLTACGVCMGETTADCDCDGKMFAPQRYLQSVQRLKEVLGIAANERAEYLQDDDANNNNSPRQDKQQQGNLDEYKPNDSLYDGSSSSSSTFYWMSMHRKPPGPGEELFSWQTGDVLYALEEYASQQLTEQGLMQHIDLRPHVLTAHPDWFNDLVHWGKNPKSFFQHFSLQVILNRVCPSA